MKETSNLSYEPKKAVQRGSSREGGEVENRKADFIQGKVPAVQLHGSAPVHT